MLNFLFACVVTLVIVTLVEFIIHDTYNDYKEMSFSYRFISLLKYKNLEKFINNNKIKLNDLIEDIKSKD